MQNPPPPPPTFTTIDAPGATSMSGYGTSGVSINSAGDIAGYFTDANGVVHGFIRRSGGSIATIDAPGAGTAPNLVRTLAQSMRPAMPADTTPIRTTSFTVISGLPAEH
jgi:hypothetical protein